MLNFSVAALVISVAFNVATSLAFVAAHRKVEKASAKNLPLLFMSASGLRLLLAAIVVTVYCFANRAQPEAIKSFVALFMAFYLATLAFDTWYFIRTEKRKR